MFQTTLNTKGEKIWKTTMLNGYGQKLLLKIRKAFWFVVSPNWEICVLPKKIHWGYINFPNQVCCDK